MNKYLSIYKAARDILERYTRQVPKFLYSYYSYRELVVIHWDFLLGGAGAGGAVFVFVFIFVSAVRTSKTSN